jgi:hypothetical protein
VNFVASGLGVGEGEAVATHVIVRRERRVRSHRVRLRHHQSKTRAAGNEATISPGDASDQEATNDSWTHPHPLSVANPATTTMK